MIALRLCIYIRLLYELLFSDLAMELLRELFTRIWRDRTLDGTAAIIVCMTIYTFFKTYMRACNSDGESVGNPNTNAYLLSRYVSLSFAIRVKRPGLSPKQYSFWEASCSPHALLMRCTVVLVAEGAKCLLINDPRLPMQSTQP